MASECRWTSYRLDLSLMPTACFHHSRQKLVFLPIGLHKFNVRNTERVCKFVKRNDGRVSLTPFKAAQVLLTKPGARFDLFLRQALFPTQARKIPTDQLAHIHAQQVAIYILSVYKL